MAKALHDDSLELFDYVTSMEADLLQLELKLQQARERIQQLENALQDSTSRIFQSLSTYEISDAQISEEYDTLRECVSNWLDGFPNVTRLNRNLKRALGGQAWNMVQRANVAMFPEGFDAAQTEILTRVVFKAIWDILFHPWFATASVRDQELMKTLEDGMALLEPKRDRRAIDAWRSDTLRAYAQGQQYQEQVQKLCYSIAKDVHGIFRHLEFTEPVNWAQKLHQFQHEIASMAARFAEMLRFSPEQYIWEWYEAENWHEIRELSKRDLNDYIIIDALTHCRVKKSKFDAFYDDDKIGDVLIVMYPALLRRRGQGQKDITIQKAVLLVRLVEQHQPTHEDITIKSEINTEDSYCWLPDFY